MAHKKYPLHQSPFYKLTTKKKLSELLNVSIDDLSTLQSNDYFKVFMQEDREIQEPRGKLRRVHDIIHYHLSKITTPEYLFSGVKGKSAVKNSCFHKESSYMIKMDIKGFYKTSKKEYVKRLFLYLFKCNPDIAFILSEIICYENFIPTGSPLSQNIAFWSHFRVFESIFSLANENYIDFSLYVDDMTFSSKYKIPLSFIGKIKYLLKKEELYLKNKKTIKYGINDYKIVTGSVISPGNKVLVQNKHKVKAIKLLSETNDKKKRSSLLGLISYCRSIQPDFFESIEKIFRVKKS